MGAKFTFDSCGGAPPEPDPALHREEAVTAADETAADEAGTSTVRGATEVRFHHSTGLPGLLGGRGLLAAGLDLPGRSGDRGRGSRRSRLTFSFRRFDHAMGLALGADRLAVAGKEQVWMLRDHSELAPAMAPAGPARPVLAAALVDGHGRDPGPRDRLGHHSCRRAGPVDRQHPVLLPGRLDQRYSFVPRWRPPFVSRLAPQDRCHLNGLAMRDGSPAFVTVMAPTDEPGGWRKSRNDTGAVLDVAIGRAGDHRPGDAALAAVVRRPAVRPELRHGPARARRPRDRAGATWSPPCRAMPAAWRSTAASPSSGLSKIRETDDLRGRPDRGLPRPAQVRRRRHRAQHRHDRRHARVRQRRRGDLRHPGGRRRAIPDVRGVRWRRTTTSGSCRHQRDRTEVHEIAEHVGSQPA